MSKISFSMLKKAFLFVFALGVTTVFADAANVLITFSTREPSAAYTGDSYQDGTRVVDGEWYVLVWTPNSAFGGFTATLGPKDPADRVLLMAPLAKNGHCPPCVFQLDSNAAPSGGSYFVYMLDTRGSDGVAAKVGAQGLPANVNGFNLTEGVRENDKLDSSLADAWEASGSLPLEAPVITAIQVLGDNVMFKVEKMLPMRTYELVSGSDLKNLKQQPVSVKSLDATANGVQFVVEKDASRFFQVRSCKTAK